MSLLHLIVGILAVWRVTHLVAAEAGPGDLLARFRRLLGNTFWGRLVACFYCLSLWVAAPFAVLLAEGSRELVLSWLAFSAGAILLERVTGSPAPATYFEDEETPS